MVANPALTGFTAPKILWLRNHEPRNFDKLRKVLLPKDEIRRRLTGEYATEVSDASGTLAVGRRPTALVEPLLSKLELDESLLARLLRIGRSHRQADAASGRGTGPLDRLPGRGRGRRLRGGAVGNGIVAKGDRFDIDRHLGRDVRRTLTRSKSIPRGAFTRSAMPYAASGTSWA